MSRADQRKFHYIYKITRVETGRFYIGMHSTDNLEDGYFGSGKIITASIKKHGKEVHSKEILEFLPTREALKLREKELVNEELLGDKLCMNLRLGGDGGGGWDHIDPVLLKQYRLLGAKAGGKVTGKRNGDIGRAKMLATRKAQGTQLSFHGKRHTQECRERISQVMKEKQAGKANSQYGTCWVIKDEKPLKIRVDVLQQYLDDGYRRGRNKSS